MAYSRAPRFGVGTGSQTGPNVAPNSYQINYDDKCSCKGTNWAPFLICSRNKTTEKTTTPAPNAYFPKTCNKILGGASLRYTAPRFPDPAFTTPGPTDYDAFRDSEKLSGEPPPRLKGYMYHCNVPYTMLGYPPTVPHPHHFGYRILEDQSIVECCDPDYDTTLGPAFYQVNFGTFGTCYRGCYWSRYSRRKLDQTSDTPGVGSYNIVPEPSQLQEYLNKVRHERKKNACVLRYIDQVENLALRNNYPSPNQYNPDKGKCVRVKKKLVPKKLVRPRKIIPEKNKQTGPAPNQYTDPRTALYYLVKPSFRKGYNAFLSNAPRFRSSVREVRPAPNEYQIKGFVEELSKKISPYAVRNTAFDTSVPKKLYFLPPEPIEQPIVCPPKSKLPAPVPRPVYPFSSKAERFTTHDDGYTATSTSYDIRKPYSYAHDQKSHRKALKYNFLFNEERFSRMTNFAVIEDKSYVPGLIYNLLKFIPGRKNNSGKFGKARRFSTQKDTGPGPLQYKVKVRTGRTFNVTLGGSTPFSPMQIYRMKLRVKPGSESQEKKPGTKANSECPEVHSVKVEFQGEELPSGKLKEKKIPD